MNTETLLIPSLFGGKPARQLVFSNDGLMLIRIKGNAVPQRIAWEELAAIRLRATAIKGLYCHIGRQYCIELKTDTDEVFTIKLNSYYGIKKDLYEQLWHDIYRQLYTFHFRQVLYYYLELHALGQLFEVSGIKIYSNGISWDEYAVLKWAELEVNVYNRYVVLHSRYGTRQRKFLYYGRDWNAWLLVEILKQVMASKNGNTQPRKTHD